MSHTEFKNSAIAKTKVNENNLREGLVMCGLFLMIVAAVTIAFANAI